MNIWIINEYAGSPHHGMTYRHYYLARAWQGLGHKTVVVSASYSHFLRSPPIARRMFSREHIDGIAYVWMKVIRYGHAHDFRRVIKWFQFAFGLFLLRFVDIARPDVIVCSPTAPFSVVPARILANIYHAKLVFEVRDIWPLTLIEIGGYSRRNVLVRIMRWFERFGLTKADIVVSNLPNYGEHVSRLGVDRTPEYVPNGASLRESGHENDLGDKSATLIPNDKFIVGYAGTLGQANALEYLIESMRNLEANQEICAVIVGTGKDHQHLRELARDMLNVRFVPPVPKDEVQSLLKKFDVCFIGLRKQALFRYGVSPNKLFDYMLAAKPVLYAIDSGKSIVETAKCGLVVDAENPTEIASAIVRMFRMSPKERDEMGSRGKDYVLRNHDYDVLAKRYLELFDREAALRL